jgi:hypothetical protein
MSGTIDASLGFALDVTALEVDVLSTALLSSPAEYCHLGTGGRHCQIEGIPPATDGEGARSVATRHAEAFGHPKQLLAGLQIRGERSCL